MSDTLIMSADEFCSVDIVDASQYQSIRQWKSSALGYVWGRQDAGDGPRDTGSSSQFADAYALAQHVTGGYAGPLQAAYHEWHDTRRIVVRQPNTGRMIQISSNGDPNRPLVQAHIAVWADGDFTRHWPGLYKGVQY